MNRLSTSAGAAGGAFPRHNKDLCGKNMGIRTVLKRLKP